MTIEKDRAETAENVYLNYDFSYEVQDASGWEWEGDEARRTIFFVDPDDSFAPTVKGAMTIRFAPGEAVPIDAAVVVHGEVVGNLMSGSLDDYVVAETPSP